MTRRQPTARYCDRAYRKRQKKGEPSNAWPHSRIPRSIFFSCCIAHPLAIVIALLCFLRPSYNMCAAASLFPRRVQRFDAAARACLSQVPFIVRHARRCLLLFRMPLGLSFPAPTRCLFLCTPSPAPPGGLAVARVVSVVAVEFCLPVSV